MPEEPATNEAATQTDRQSHWAAVVAVLTHPIGLLLLSFLLTGIAATVFSKWLDNLAKARELELAAGQRAVESVRIVTDLLYERRIRAVLVSSAILRNAPVDEIKERKKSYDDAFVRWNASLQSNMFRVRQMFRVEDYSTFEALLEDNVRPLFTLQDSCITLAYDTAISVDEIKRPGSAKILSDCVDGSKPSVSIERISLVILDCIYLYTDALYRINQNDTVSETSLLYDNYLQAIRKFCDSKRLLEEAHSPAH